MQQPPPNRSPMMFLKAAVSTIAVGFVFVYLIGLMAGKKGPEVFSPPEDEAGAGCEASAKIAQSVRDLAKGEVAAMTVAKAPEKLADLAFNGPDGQPTRISAFAGKTVLFNTWATWCVPCRGEMPALDRLQAEKGSDKFQVVAVNIDTSRLDRPKAFLDEIGVKSLTFYADPKAEIFQDLKQDGKALGLPTTILIGPDGCQVGLMNGPAAWDSADAKALIDAAVTAAQPQAAQ